MSPLKDCSDIWKSAGGILIVAVCFQPWEGIARRPPVQGQKEEPPLLTRKAEHPGVPRQGGKGSLKK